MAIQDIQSMYDKLYSSKYNDLVNKKQTSLGELSNQETGVTNKYQELTDTLNKRKTDTSAQYKNLYTGLDNQQKEGDQNYYNERNQASVQNVQQSRAIRDWMARNNLLQSGESADALMRNNTDYNNNMGTISTNQSSYNKGLLDKRNQYSLAEQSAYEDISNQLSAGEREKAQSLAAILSQRNQLEGSFLNNIEALKAETEASKMKDILSWQEQERAREWQAEQSRIAWEREQQAAAEQRAFQAQQAALSRSSSRSSGGGSGGSGTYKTADVKNAIAEMINQSSGVEAQKYLNNNKDAIVNSIGLSAYNQAKQAAINKTISVGRATYGVTTKRVNTTGNRANTFTTLN